MKTKILFVLLALLPSASFAQRVRDVGNGGDAIVLEFKGIARSIAHDIKEELAFLFPEFTAKDLENAIETTTVVSVPVTKLRGVEKDAINYPARKLIQLSQARWPKNFEKPDRVRALVLHEYLGIMKIEDGDFKISERLLKYYDTEKQRIEKMEIVGRLFLTDQMSYSIAYLTLSYEGKIKLQATFENVSRDCEGTYEWDRGPQRLKATMVCNGVPANLLVDFWGVEAIDFLREGLVSVVWKYQEFTPAGKVSFEFNKPVDAKKMR